MAQILWFENYQSADAPELGGKNASLGTLTGAGLPVPPGFAVSADCYRKVLADGGLTGQIDALIAAVDARDPASVAAAGGPAPTARGALKAVHIGAVTVLADANGRTLYWFAPDTAVRSACYGSCAAYWPPVKGPVTAGPGITGKLSVLTRSDGSVQPAYNGHPLYTYVGDSAPGQANGNGLNLNGGLWHEVPASG